MTTNNTSSSSSSSSSSIAIRQDFFRCHSFSDIGENEIDIDELAPVKTFLHTVFESRIQLYLSAAAKGNGRSTSYDILLQQLRKKEDADTLLKVFLCLPNFTDLLIQRRNIFSSLFDQIFAHNWKSSDNKTNSAVSSLICQIVTLNSSFLQRAFSNLTQHFNKTEAATLTETDAATVQIGPQGVWYIHKTIYEISRQVPTSHSVLFGCMQKSFPAKRFRKDLQVEYARQLLVICGYVNGLEGKVLELIIKRCLELDVEIVIEDRCGGLPVVQLRPQADEDGDGEGLDNEGQEQTQEAQGDSQEKPRTDTAEDLMSWEVSQTADKLDALLSMLMNYLEQQLNVSDGTAFDRLNQQLLTVFEDRVLCAHRTKFIQFLLFFASMKSYKFCTLFLTHLLALALSPSQPVLKRQCAVMYYSSFVARAGFLSIDYASDLVGNLISWAGEYVLSVPVVESDLSSDVFALSLDNMAVDEQGLPITNGTAGGTSRHLVFYSVMQAACYVMCFLGVELAHKQRANLKLRQAWEVTLGCSFDPLRYCIKSVKWEFLRLTLFTDLVTEKGRQAVWSHAARNIRLWRRDSISEAASSRRPSEDADCSGILLPEKGEPAKEDCTAVAEFVSERKQYRGRSVSFASDLSPNPTSKPPLVPRFRGMSADLDSGVSTNVFNPLDSFFPFDPCLLKVAHSMIAEGYRSWDGVPGLLRTWNPHLADVSQSSEVEESENTPLENTEGSQMDCDSNSSSDGEDEEEEDDDSNESLNESTQKIGSFGEEKAEDVDPFMRRYRHGGALDKELLVKTGMMNGSIEDDSREVSNLYGYGAAKRCSPTATLPIEGEHRRRRYSITSSMDW